MRSASKTREGQSKTTGKTDEVRRCGGLSLSSPADPSASVAPGIHGWFVREWLVSRRGHWSGRSWPSLQELEETTRKYGLEAGIFKAVTKEGDTKDKAST